MESAALPITLARLAPEHEGSIDCARRYAGHLATILNTDDGLPGLGRGRDDPVETAESVLSHVTEWCLTRNALFYAVVLNDTAIGSISLSRIDLKDHTSRVGYWLGTSYRGRHYAATAFAQILEKAREMGLRRVSGAVPESTAASRKMWKNQGAQINTANDEVTIFLDDHGTRS